MTKYVLLWSSEGNGEWSQVAGHREARSAKEAIRVYAETDGVDLGKGFYVAVPARSWKPVTVSVETKTSLKFS